MRIISKNVEYDFMIYQNTDDSYEVNIENEDGCLMGEISFVIKQNKTWIYNIYTEKEFQHRGVGQALLDICEFCSALNDVKKIEGLYCPSNAYAYNFYEKNGFIFENKRYEIIIKKEIDIEKVKLKMKDRIKID